LRREKACTTKKSAKLAILPLKIRFFIIDVGLISKGFQHGVGRGRGGIEKNWGEGLGKGEGKRPHKKKLGITTPVTQFFKRKSWVRRFVQPRRNRADVKRLAPGIGKRMKQTAERGKTGLKCGKAT